MSRLTRGGTDDDESSALLSASVAVQEDLLGCAEGKDGRANFDKACSMSRSFCISTSFSVLFFMHGGATSLAVSLRVSAPSTAVASCSNGEAKDTPWRIDSPHTSATATAGRARSCGDDCSTDLLVGDAIWVDRDAVVSVTRANAEQ